MSADPNLAAGIAAVQAGDLARAQTLLAAVVRATPASVDGWWWLAQAVTAPERRQFCLDRVLALDPLHVGALRMLASGAAAPAAEPVPTPPPEPAYVSPLLRAVRTAPPGIPPAEPAPAPTMPVPEPAAPPRSAPPDFIAALREQTPAAAVPTPAKAPARKLRVTPAVLAAMVAGGLLLWVCAGAAVLALNPGLLAAFAPPPTLDPALLGPSATAVSYPTLPPEWTATPTRDPLAVTPTPVPSRTPRASATPALDLAAQVAALQDQIETARKYMINREYDRALQKWNEVLAAAPDYAYAYDQRGEAYLQGADEDQTFVANLQAALADFDTAIALDPTVGDYYLHRYYAFRWLADNSVYRVDRDYWNTLGLASARTANDLGNSDELSARYPALALAQLGECAAARAEYEALLAAQADDTGGLHRGLALAYACQLNYSAALTNINAALAISNYEEWQLDRAGILYQMGRYSEAEVAVNNLMAANPYSCDCRLYLRVLVRYAQSDPAGAEDDFYRAEGSGRVSEGLGEYYLGRLAQAAGDTEAAITYYQQSEAALKVVFSALRNQVIDRLTSLGAAPLDLSADALPTPTPIAPRPVPQPPPLGPEVLDRPEGYIGEPIGQAGTGPFTLKPGQSRDFQFQSTPPDPGGRLGFNLYLIGPAGAPTGAESGLRLTGWRQGDDTWVEVAVLWGAQQIADGTTYITNTYDVFTTLTNTSDAPITVENLQLYINDPEPPEAAP